MNPDDFRELTPEEAETALQNAPDEPMSKEELDSLTRKTFILVGIIPLSEMTPDECWWHLCHVRRFAPKSSDYTV